MWSVTTLLTWHYFQPSQSSPWLYLICNPLTLEFTAGCFIALLFRHWQPNYPAFIALLGIATTLLSWQLWVRGNSLEFPIAGDRVTYFLIPCALLLMGVVGMESRGYVFGRLLQHLGDTSYSIYLTHMLFLSIGRRLWQAYGDQSSIFDSLLWWSGLFALTLCGGILCFHLLEKPMLSALRRLVRPN
jgi:peptidoglycan/LPS O-acetylase OafA/YrhL